MRRIAFIGGGPLSGRIVEVPDGNAAPTTATVKGPNPFKVHRYDAGEFADGLYFMNYAGLRSALAEAGAP